VAKRELLIIPPGGAAIAGALAIIVGATHAPAQVWTELGPAMIPGGPNAFAGRVSAIACSRTNSSLYYCTGADGGVWKTTNAGVSWSPLTDHMPTTAMGALALDPVNESIIYAGTGEANFANHSRPGVGFLRSTDAGATWSVLGSATFAGRCISRILINPASTSTLYASVTRAGGFPAPAAAKGHPQANGPRGVFKSLDSGLTWTQLAGGLPALDCTDMAMDPVDPATLYAAVGFIFGDAANGIYKSTNSGATWTKLAGGLPAAPGRIALAIAPANRNRLYTLIANPADAAGGGGSTLGAFRSDNAGVSWTSLPIGSIQATYGWYLCTVGVSPTDQSLVTMGGLQAGQSTNAGASWLSLGVPHVDIHAIVYDAAGRLLIASDGGVFRRDGSSFTYLNGGLGTIQFYAGISTDPDDEDVVIGGTQDNGTLRRTSSTVSWSPVLGGDGGWTQVDQTSPNIVYAESQGTGSFYKSTNFAAAFSFAGSGLSGRNCFLPPFLIDPEDSGRLIYGTERLWESLDSASSWHPLSTDLTAGGIAAIRTLAIAPSDARYVYAATNDGRVQASSNFGVSFSIILQNQPGWPRVTRELFVDPSDPLTLYVAGAGYGTVQVRRTRDAGLSWEVLDGDLPDLPVNVIAADTRYPTPRLYAGTDAGLYSSRDDGATWTLHTTTGGGRLPNACVIDLKLETARNRLIAATQGRGAWQTPIYCPADFDENGFVNGVDFDDFVLEFVLGTDAADFDANTFVNGDDFDAFLLAFEAGC